MDETFLINLLQKASDIRKHAYAPYSRFLVGSAILLEDGRIFEGVNIENSSYPVSLCAERAAMATVVSFGLQHLVKALAVVTSASPPGSPCGMCRQFLGEFLGPDTPIIFGNDKGEWKILAMADLLPLPFAKAALI
jgi:cytidine deaminase